MVQQGLKFLFPFKIKDLWREKDSYTFFFGSRLCFYIGKNLEWETATTLEGTEEELMYNCSIASDIVFFFFCWVSKKSHPVLFKVSN